MNEYKFRAWNVTDGYMVDSKVGVANILKKHILEGNYKTGWYTENTSEDNYILMQYTGLKDKKDKEIYEGDIVQCIEYECYGYIGWNEECGSFYFYIITGRKSTEEEQLYDYIDELNVIGNIYENKDLLEVENE